jgi:hypothetical protein
MAATTAAASQARLVVAGRRREPTLRVREIDGKSELPLRSCCLSRKGEVLPRSFRAPGDRPERNPSSTFWLVYGREGERALPSAE